MPLSSRLAAILDALPLESGTRVLEVGCGPGALARAMAERCNEGFVLAIDRSAKAILQAEALSKSETGWGRLAFRQVAIEDFALEDGQEPFDLVVAVRVGALDGRHPADGVRAMRRIATLLKPSGRLLADGRDVPVLR